MFNRINFSQKIKKIRLAKGLTQEQVANRMGIDTSSYSNLERGKTTPLVTSLFKLLSAFNITIDEFFDYQEIDEELKIDRINLKIYNSLSLKKKQCLYKIFKALE